MFLKILIVVLLLCVIASLFSGLFFLFKDADRSHSKRTWYALGIRVAFAAALLLAIFYGFQTGQLQFGTSAPWHDRAGQPSAP